MRSFVHMKRNLTLPITYACLLLTSEASAQGCSDAGVCTAGPIGELSITDSAATLQDPPHMFRLTFSYAVGEQNTTILLVVPEIALGLTDRWGVQLRVPYQSANGNLGSNSGIGDPLVTTSYAFVKDGTRRLEAIVGAKFPANKADAGLDGKPLPMPYQTSLGTTDLLLGVNFRSKRWNTALAYQHVLSNGNANGFRHSAWPENEDAEGYFESWDLDRADDAVARLQYAIPIKRLTLQLGLLGIYHVAMDSRLAVAEPSVWSNDTTPYRFTITGSDGLTLNITADARYPIGDHWSLEASFGTPVITRDVRPDGLTRSMVLNAGLAYRFGK